MRAISTALCRLQRFSVFLFTPYAIMMCCFMLIYMAVGFSYTSPSELVRLDTLLFVIPIILVFFLTLVVLFRHLFKRASSILDAFLLAFTSCLVLVFWWVLSVIVRFADRISGLSSLDPQTFFKEYDERMEAALEAGSRVDVTSLFIQDALSALPNNWLLLLLLLLTVLYIVRFIIALFIPAIQLSSRTRSEG